MPNTQEQSINKVKEILMEDERLVSDDEKILKNKVAELARKLDDDLIELLLESKETKERFFKKAGKVTVFDVDAFTSFVHNKDFLPDSYTSFKNKIGLTNERGDLISRSNEVVLSWPYKDCVLEGGQTKENTKRDEIFWNEVLAPDEIRRLFEPKVLTSWQRVDKDGEHEIEDLKENKEGNLQENLVIQGNNLLALHSIKERFTGGIKLIYIDPPYNTPGDANTFNYNNNFNHSSWLTFMKNRLEVSKQLLKEDGVIAIAIDDVEQAYLKVLCDEVFGRENFMNTLVIQSKAGGRSNDTYLATSHEYVLFYSKKEGAPKINFFELPEEKKEQYKHGEGEDSYRWRAFLRTGGYSTPEERPNSHYPIYYNPEKDNISLEQIDDNYIEILPVDSNGKKRVWRKIPESFQEHVDKEEIKITKSRNDKWKVKIMDKIKEGVRPNSVWVDGKYDASTHGTKLLKDMFDGKKVFSFPKSLYAVQDVIKMFVGKDENDFVLDFFAGSGTTAEAVIDLNENDGGNRKYILCEQMDYIEDVTNERIKKSLAKADSNSTFVYVRLKSLNKEYRKRIKSATKNELENIWKEIQENGFLSWQIDLEKINEEADSFDDLLKKDMQKFLLEVLDNNHLYVNYGDIDDERYEISEDDKDLNKEFYE